MSICYIIGSAPFDKSTFISPSKDDFVICADGGYDTLLPLGITPDLIVGDFDSIFETKNYQGEIIRLVPEKDDTDMLSAVKTALSRGWREFYLYGGLGGRLDHTFANIQLLSYLLDRHAKGTLFDGKTMVTMIEDGIIKLKKEDDCYFSVFSFTESCPNVTLKGVKYPLNHACITSSFPIGVSNEITEDKAEISNQGGRLLIMLTPKKPQ